MLEEFIERELDQRIDNFSMKDFIKGNWGKYFLEI